MSELRTFYPISRNSYEDRLDPGQRYRHPYNDKRLADRVNRTMDMIEKNRSSVLSHCAEHRSEAISMYRLLSNSKLDLAELIYRSCDLSQTNFRGKELYVPIDESSLNLFLGISYRKDWAEKYGVINDNYNPGFMIVPSLILDAHQSRCYGLGDILFHTRPRATADAKANERLSRCRAKLPLAQRETGIWSIVASNTADQLRSADQVTFIMDQGADTYESLAQLRLATERDFIVRAKVDRCAKGPTDTEAQPFSQLLEKLDLIARRTVQLNKLHHRSKTSKRIVERKRREAKLEMKYMQVQVATPYNYGKSKPKLPQTLSLVEVKECASTVPRGEKPIHWRLLTSWEVLDEQMAWKVVEAYQRRWDIEQLFRLLKKQSYNVEASQLGHPEKIKKLVVMALKASALALQLVAAREGEDLIDIQTVFDDKQVKALQLMNERYKGQTEKTINPHPTQSLAWAAWIVARAGHWQGYSSQRKPGPITMIRGLKELDLVTKYLDLINDT